MKECFKKMLIFLLAAATAVLPVSGTAFASEADVDESAEDIGAFPEETKAETFTVTLAETENGKLAFYDTIKTEAEYAEGDEVIVYVEPDEGYEFSEITLKSQEADAYAVEDSDPDKEGISFVMPAEDISVNAEFNEIEEAADEDTEEIPEEQFVEIPAEDPESEEAAGPDETEEEDPEEDYGIETFATWTIITPSGTYTGTTSDSQTSSGSSNSSGSSGSSSSTKSSGSSNSSSTSSKSSGSSTSSLNGVCKASDGNWYYYVNGVKQTSYTGFASNSNGKWYVENGKVTKKKNGVLKDSTGAIGSKNAWYYVVGSKVQTSFTGLANYSNSSGWWYITNGKVDRSYNGLAKNKNGWYYLTNGKVDRSYTGFASNSNGKWYVEKGKVTKKKNGVLKDSAGAVGAKNTWYYVVGSKVQTNFTGLANYSNSSGWWYITNGKVDRSYNGLAKNKNGWYYLTNGKVDRSYTGFASNSNGKWYVEKGKVTKKKNGVLKDSTGAVGSKNEWYYVIGSKVQTSFTGLADYSNSSGWWYITKGKVDRSYTGIATNKNGTWYVKNGKVQKNYSGTVTFNGKTYTVTNGKAKLKSGSSGSSSSGSSGSSSSGSTYKSDEVTVNGVTFNLDSFPETYNTSSGGSLFIGIRPESSINYNDITYKITGNTVTKLCDENTEKVYMPSDYDNYAVYEIGSSWSNMVAQVEIYYQTAYIPWRVEFAVGFKTGSFSISAYYKGSLIRTCKVNQDCTMDWRPEKIARSIEEATWTDDMTRAEKMNAVIKYIGENYTYSELNCTGGASVLYIAARDLGYTNVRYRNVDTSTYDYSGMGDVFVYNSAGWGGGHTCIIADGDEESGGRNYGFEAQGAK